MKSQGMERQCWFSLTTRTETNKSRSIEQCNMLGCRRGVIVSLNWSRISHKTCGEKRAASFSVLSSPSLQHS